MEGTMQLCEDLDVAPDEDCVLYSIAYELKSPRMGEWNRKGWNEGWRNLGYVPLLRSGGLTDCCISCDSISSMKGVIGRLRVKLGSDPAYFQKVYNHTFDFARAPGQRSLRMFFQHLLGFYVGSYLLNACEPSYRDCTGVLGDADPSWTAGWGFGAYLLEGGGRG